MGTDICAIGASLPPPATSVALEIRGAHLLCGRFRVLELVAVPVGADAVVVHVCCDAAAVSACACYWVSKGAGNVRCREGGDEGDDLELHFGFLDWW